MARRLVNLSPFQGVVEVIVSGRRLKFERQGVFASEIWDVYLLQGDAWVHWGKLRVARGTPRSLVDALARRTGYEAWGASEREGEDQ